LTDAETVRWSRRVSDITGEKGRERETERSEESGKQREREIWKGLRALSWDGS